MPITSKENEQKTEQPTVQLLVFSLANEEYALGLTEIQEIVQTPEITPVPNMPESVKGIANLRGRVVTVIDLEQLQIECFVESFHRIFLDRKLRFRVEVRFFSKCILPNERLQIDRRDAGMNIIRTTGNGKH